MKKNVFVLIAFTLLIACTPAKYKNLEEGLYAEIVTDKGDILLELFVEEVPMTVASFVSLAEGTNTKVSEEFKGVKYYDGLTFHRVVDNFIIQGGDPTATGTGSPGFTFADEFVKDENGKLINSHDDAGVLSMANPGPNANGSQFFITHKEIPYLDAKHTVFGKTVVNSLQLTALKTKIKDSLKLVKAIDSIRMVAVNSIRKSDTINTVKIIRIGAKAKAFNASKVFESELLKSSETEKELKKKAALEEEARYSKYLKDKTIFLNKMDESKAVKTDSGLRILMLKKILQVKKL
ncbi:peptidylprolyl isomerase [Polaribacter ponticola]|uniref:Peptidyl-prolyl cis-trans isomerase n=1 Tax=Polaribacter ponticola TaxID=2978475 RepID=A0ABT5S9F5_9FLAO|nr:peptidylprolyl isomerase [Polaribacter sp. MSW5]MDD7914205.1 peptidylprolyl isomerase [Polaribacter sp. MSW5]